MADNISRQIGVAVLALREQRGLTQNQLAVKLGVKSGQIISSIEKGQRALKAIEIARIADIFHVSFSDLVKGTCPETPFVLWREEDHHDAAARREEEALFLHRCRRFAFIEDLTNSRPAATLPTFTLNLQRARFEDMEAWAEQVRGSLGLGDYPAPQLRQALEQRGGVKIFFAELKGGSGTATNGDFGDAILVNSTEPAPRRAFSLAHELFHLLTWESVARKTAQLSQVDRDRNEKLANAFASALLMPLSDLRQRFDPESLQRPAWHRLLPVAAAFAVSPPALVWRLVNLNLLTESAAQSLLAKRQDRTWGAVEFELPLPRRFVLLAFQAWAEGQISVGKLAEIIETTAGLLRNTLAQYDLDMDLDVEEATGIPA